MSIDHILKALKENSLRSIEFMELVEGFLESKLKTEHSFIQVLDSLFNHN